MAILECEKISYLYSVGTPFETAAVNNVDFSCEKGEIIGVIGHTGSGKSTLIQHLNGLIEPSDGRVLLDGKDIWSKENKKNIRQVRFAVGLCFQYPEYQIFEETVFREIAFGPGQMGLDEEEIAKRVYESMAYVGISRELEKKSPFDLSGGQKRRVAIASIIAMKPEVLILDEPCAGLDPKGRDRILNLITSYQKQEGNTVIFVSHSMEDIAKIADRVLVMNKGEVAMFGSVREVFSRASELKTMGLNIPEITDVFLKLRKRGINCRTDIYTVEQAKEEYLRLLSERGLAEC
ncbi:MAG: energy-coupling factor transporter ATPase [Eubacterium sp.]|nr:energy-coupling factor transporter ATPase [Eubacterium sp.]